MPTKVIKNAFRRMGLEIHRYSANASPTTQIISAFREFEVDLVFDIGANYGQFATEIRSGGYSNEIVSFEPLSEAHSVLQKASENDPRWQVHARCALGDRNGEVEINIAGNSVSSSILPMLESHKAAAPASVYMGKETVAIQTLDAIAQQYLRTAQAPFLKIDTQGFEWEVLNGARDTLPNIRGLLLELTLSPLYGGQHLWRETIERLEAEGFSLWALQPGFTDPINGRTLQVDGMFFRET